MIWIEQNHSSKAVSLSDSQETASPLMCSHWTLPVGGESFQHPLIMFFVDSVVGEGDEILKQEPLLHTKMAFTYCDPTRVMASSFLRFLNHTQRRTTVGKTFLDE
jgi:hypothetical protein